MQKIIPTGLLVHPYNIDRIMNMIKTYICQPHTFFSGCVQWSGAPRPVPGEPGARGRRDLRIHAPPLLQEHHQLMQPVLGPSSNASCFMQPVRLNVMQPVRLNAIQAVLGPINSCKLF